MIKLGQEKVSFKPPASKMSKNANHGGPMVIGTVVSEYAEKDGYTGQDLLNTMVQKNFQQMKVTAKQMTASWVRSLVIQQ